MMQTTIDIRELSTRFAEVVSQAKAGAEVIVMDGDTPCARLIPFAPPQPRLPGLHAGAIHTAPDFDDPLPDDFWAGQS